LLGETTREYTVIDSEIKFIEVTTEHSLTTDIKELADDIGYGKIIMNHEKITVIKKIKL
jgi:hypothetical protein